MSKNYFALLITDHSVTLARAGKAGTLHSYYQKELPAGVIERGEIKNTAALQTAVAGLVKAARIRCRFVIVGLPEIRSFTRTFNLPPLPVAEIADAVRWESEPLLPFPLAEAYLDWMILDRTTETCRVLVVALPKDLVDGYVALLEGLALQPVAVEITSLSLARLAPPLKTAQLILNLEPREAVLAAIGPGGGIEVSSTANYDNPSGSLDEVARAIATTIAFYRKKTAANTALGQNPVSQIILTGSALNADTAPRLNKLTGLPVNLLKNIKPDQAVATSLAGKEVASPVDEQTINLIPPRIQGLYDRESRLEEMTTWLKISLLALFLVFLGSVGLWLKLGSDIRQVEAQTKVLQMAESVEFQTIEKEALFLNNRAQKVIALHVPFSSRLALFEWLANQSPAGITLSQLVFDGSANTFLVSGIAATRADLVNFRQILEKKEGVKSVRIPLSSLEKEENADFTVSLTTD